jgi:hypothetical protein
MKEYDWKDNETVEVFYYFEKDTGKIVGQTNQIAHTKIWLSKIIGERNEEGYLGQYITLSHSKKAIEEYWSIQSRTLLE